jgi:hypothetical protein
MCNLLSDLNVVMRKTDALMRLGKRYSYWHNLSCLSLCISYLCLCKYNDLCTDATSLFLRCSASRTLSLSLCFLALFPLHSVLHIRPWQNLFVISLIAIKSSDKHHCFTQRAEHDNCIQKASFSL